MRIPLKMTVLPDTELVDVAEWIQVDPRGDNPLFDQLRTQIINGIRDGRLRRAPGCRRCAISRRTWGWPSIPSHGHTRELESAGVLETRGRFGSFVARVDTADAAMAAAANAYVESARAMGLGRAEALTYIDAAFDRID